jgi:hypothetical protein
LQTDIATLAETIAQATSIIQAAGLTQGNVSSKSLLNYKVSVLTRMDYVQDVVTQGKVTSNSLLNLLTSPLLTGVKELHLSWPKGR